MSVFKAIFLFSCMLYVFTGTAWTQCKYQYEKRDAISDARVFKTESILLAKKFKTTEKLKVVKLFLAYEKTSDQAQIELLMTCYHPQGKVPNLKPELILKLNQGQVLHLPLQNQSLSTTGAGRQHFQLTYQLNDEVLDALQSADQLAALRIPAMNQSIDLEEFLNDPVALFQNCWQLED